MKFERLPGGEKFSRLFEGGSTLVGNWVVVYFRRREEGPVRAGFAAGKKLGGAVFRNRLRRRMREALRTLPDRGRPADLVLLARSTTGEVRFSCLRSEIRSLLDRGGILRRCQRREKGIPSET